MSKSCSLPSFYIWDEHERMVFDVLSKLKAVVVELEELEAEYKRNREGLMLGIASVLNAGNIPQEVIDYYYWESGLSGEPLADALGVKLASLNKKVTEYQISVKCNSKKCNNLVFFPVKTKSEMITKKAEKKRVGVMCPDCIKISEDKKKAKEQKKRETRKAKNQQKIEELQAMPYEEYLKTPHWNKTRRAALVRARYSCSECYRMNVPLDVHHLTYEHRGYEYPRDLKVVCRRCHERIHGRKFNSVLV